MPRRRGREATLARELRDDVRDDLRGNTPTLDTDFHHPCPECGTEVVIHADQPIRRARCPGCRIDLTLDTRIGGALCLLPFQTEAHESDRRALQRSKWLRSRIAIYAGAAVGIGVVLGLGAIAPPVLLLAAAIAVVAALIGAEHALSGTPSRRRGRGRGRRQRRGRP